MSAAENRWFPGRTGAQNRSADRRETPRALPPRPRSFRTSDGCTEPDERAALRTRAPRVAAAPDDERRAAPPPPRSFRKQTPPPTIPPRPVSFTSPSVSLRLREAAQISGGRAESRGLLRSRGLRAAVTAVRSEPHAAADLSTPRARLLGFLTSKYCPGEWKKKRNDPKSRGRSPPLREGPASSGPGFSNVRRGWPSITVTMETELGGALHSLGWTRGMAGLGAPCDEAGATPAVNCPMKGTPECALSWLLVQLDLFAFSGF